MSEKRERKHIFSLVRLGTGPVLWAKYYSAQSFKKGECNYDFEPWWSKNRMARIRVLSRSPKVDRRPPRRYRFPRGDPYERGEGGDALPCSQGTA